MQPMVLSIGSASYAAAAAAFLFLLVLLVTSWRGRLPGIMLAAASLGTIAWASALAYLSSYPQSIPLFAALLEVLRNALWFAFLMVLLGYAIKAVRLFKISIVVIAVTCAMAAIAAIVS